MKKLNLNQTNKSKRLIKIIFVVFVMVLILEVWMVNRLSNYGDKISELKMAQDSLKLENEVLESKLAQASSLTDTYKQASVLGFTELKNIEYLKTQTIASN